MLWTKKRLLKELKIAERKFLATKKDESEKKKLGFTMGWIYRYFLSGDYKEEKARWEK